MQFAVYFKYLTLVAVNNTAHVTKAQVIYLAYAELVKPFHCIFISSVKLPGAHRDTSLMGIH